MPTSLPDDIGVEKNKLDSKYAWLWLVDVYLTDEIIKYFVNTRKIFTYQDTRYAPLNFNVGEWETKTGAGLPSRQLSVSGSRLMNILRPYIKTYTGLIDKKIILTPVNSGYPNLDMSNKSQEFKVLKASQNEKGIVFTLGAQSLLSEICPRDHYNGPYCRYVDRFKGPRCKYAAEATTCNGTMPQCKEYENLDNFGGQPGMRSKRVRYAV